MPNELQLLMCLYLTSKDMITTLQTLSRYWRGFVKNKKLWKAYVALVRPLGIKERLLITQCLVERRSKGKLYVTRDIITDHKYLLRKIYLDVTNAGQDDGLPTSVLREISHLKALSHQNLGKIEWCEVNQSLTQIVYQHYDMNLKEYFKKNSVIQ